MKPAKSVVKPFKIPSGIKFVTPYRQLVRHAVELMRSEVSNDRRAIIILGPPASGKTRLATALLELIDPAPACTIAPAGADSMASLLSASVGRPYIWLDDYELEGSEGPRGERRPLPRGRDTVLRTFMTARRWTFRPLFQSEVVTRPVAARIVLTSSAARVSPEFARRAIVINLAGGAA